MKSNGPDRPPAGADPSVPPPGPSPSRPPSAAPIAPAAANVAADPSPHTPPGASPAGAPANTGSSKWLWLAVVAMLIQQAFSYLSTLVLPIAAPAISESTGLGISLVGVYTAVMYVASTLSAGASGSFIQRYGALRVSQAALVLMGLGLVFSWPGWVLLFALTAFVIGSGSAVSTPASSDILGRYCPPRHAPLIFSIKQTGVPVGGMLAGVLVPAFTIALGWEGAFIACGAMCLVLAFVLQPLRAEFDQHRVRSHRISTRAVVHTVRAVLVHPRLRELALFSVSWVGLQAIYGAFLFAFLADGLGYPPETAGWVFAAGNAAAVGARILWGWIASRFVDARALLGWLAVVMAAASIATASFGPGWPVAAVAVVAVIYAGTAISWHGVLLAEIARLSPVDRIGAMTGGVLLFTSTGIMVYPLLYGAILEATGSYAPGFVAAALPALYTGLRMLLRRGRAASPR